MLAIKSSMGDVLASLQIDQTAAELAAKPAQVPSWRSCAPDKILTNYLINAELAAAQASGGP